MQVGELDLTPQEPYQLTGKLPEKPDALEQLCLVVADLYQLGITVTDIHIRTHDGVFTLSIAH